MPLLFRGFELETELTVQAIEKGFRVAEVEIPFRARAEGGQSKLPDAAGRASASSAW